MKNSDVVDKLIEATRDAIDHYEEGFQSDYARTQFAKIIAEFKKSITAWPSDWKGKRFHILNDDGSIFQAGRFDE